MNLLKRLSNIWTLSELEPVKVEEKLKETDVTPQKAIIIKKDTSVEDFLHD